MKTRDLRTVIIIIFNTLILALPTYFIVKKYFFKPPNIEKIILIDKNLKYKGDTYNLKSIAKYKKHNSSTERDSSIINTYYYKFRSRNNSLFPNIFDATGFIKNYEVIRHEFFLDNEVVFDAKYEFDSSGFRKSSDKVKQKSHLILAGGSIVFGDGLNQNQTISHYLSQDFKTTNIYTVAFSGFGPAQVWKILKELDLKKYIKEKEGKLIYFLFNFHLERVCGSDWSLSLNKDSLAKLRFESNKIVQKGFINNHDDFIKGDKCLDLVSAILQDIRFNYLKLYPKGEFLIHMPNLYSKNVFQIDRELVKKLKAAGLKVFSYKKITTKEDRELLNSGSLFFPVNTHPNHRGSKYFSSKIKKCLENCK